MLKSSLSKFLKPTTKKLGDAAELAAESYLQQQGLKTLKKNYRCKAGEIDLVMTTTSHLVFVEVRMRNNKQFGDGLDSITTTKQRKISRAAQHFLQTNPTLDLPCRFDAISVSKGNVTHNSASQNQQGYTFNWVQNAFEATE